MEYKLKYYDNIGGEDDITSYATEEEAEAAIEEELENVKEYFQSVEYDYGDFGANTEFWVKGGDEYAVWERLWK